MSTERARTSIEMEFYASLQSCPRCGARIEPEPLNLYGQDTGWALTGNCAKCGNPVAYTFVTYGNPIEGARKWGELGRGHSEIITPRMFIDEIERLSPTIETDPTRLGPAEWTANRDANKRVHVALTELAKFLPVGADSIPESAIRAEDRADRSARADRYRRAWIEAMAARHKGVIDANVKDLPRIARLDEEATAKRPKGIDWIERDPLQRHEAWVERGRKGKGRLIVVGAEHDDMNIGRGVELSAAQFYDVSLPSVYLMDAKLHDAELTNCRLDGGKLYGAELDGATVRSSSFKNADLETAQLKNATIEGTDFSDAELHLSEWKGTKVSDSKFERARFGDADLDGATFRGCNFRGADFGADDEDSQPATKARFENCDLRETNWEGRDLSGASFINCKFAGAKGRPAEVRAVVIEKPDTDELFSLWGIR